MTLTAQTVRQLLGCTRKRVYVDMETRGFGWTGQTLSPPYPFPNWAAAEWAGISVSRLNSTLEAPITAVLMCLLQEAGLQMSESERFVSPTDCQDCQTGHEHDSGWCVSVSECRCARSSRWIITSNSLFIAHLFTQLKRRVQALEAEVDYLSRSYVTLTLPVDEQSRALAPREPLGTTSHFSWTFSTYLTLDTLHQYAICSSKKWIFGI